MSLSYYLGLLDFEDRIEAVRAGIEATVEDGDRVLDLGCGLGTFAFFAARAGAERVVAVDGDPVVHVARSVARANGLDERVEFVRGRLPDADVGGAFDVLVFEDFPRRLLDDRTHRLLRRVEERLLAPGARAVPRAARLCLAPVEASGTGADEPEPRRRFHRYGIDWSPARSYLANEPQSGSLPVESLLAGAEIGPSVTLLPVPDADDLRVEGRWRLGAGARVDALALWFDLEAAPGAWISNAPGPGSGPWGQLALPLDPPLRVGGDGVVKAEVRREPFSDGAPGWLAWRAASGPEESGGHEFAAYPAALDDLFGEEPGPSEEREEASGEGRPKGPSTPGRGSPDGSGGRPEGRRRDDDGR